MPLSRPRSRRSSCHPPTKRRAPRGHTGQAFFAYSTNYLVDVENAIIGDVEATTAIPQAEVLAAQRMIERSLEWLDLYPSRLLGTQRLGLGRDARLVGVRACGEPHVTAFDKSARTDGIFLAGISAMTMWPSSTAVPPVKLEPSTRTRAKRRA